MSLEEHWQERLWGQVNKVSEELALNPSTVNAISLCRHSGKSLVEQEGQMISLKDKPQSIELKLDHVN